MENEHAIGRKVSDANLASYGLPHFSEGERQIRLDWSHHGSDIANLLI